MTFDAPTMSSPREDERGRPFQVASSDVMPLLCRRDPCQRVLRDVELRPDTAQLPTQRLQVRHFQAAIIRQDHQGRRADPLFEFADRLPLLLCWHMRFTPFHLPLW